MPTAEPTDLDPQLIAFRARPTAGAYYASDTEFRGRCSGCDWTTEVSADADDINRQAEEHIRSKHYCDL